MDKYTWSLDELYTSFNSEKFKNDYKKLEENIKNAPAVAGAFSFYFCKWIILQCKLLCFP